MSIRRYRIYFEWSEKYQHWVSACHKMNISTSLLHGLIHMFLSIYYFFCKSLNLSHIAINIVLMKYASMYMDWKCGIQIPKYITSQSSTRKNYIFCCMITSNPNSNYDVCSLIWISNSYISPENNRCFMWTWWLMEYHWNYFFLFLLSAFTGKMKNCEKWTAEIRYVGVWFCYFLTPIIEKQISFNRYGVSRKNLSNDPTYILRLLW